MASGTRKSMERRLGRVAQSVSTGSSFAGGVLAESRVDCGVHYLFDSFKRINVGLALLGVSVLAYSGASFCQRLVASRCDPIWVTFFRAAVPALLLAPVILRRHCREIRICRSSRTCLILLASAVMIQLAGNLPFQWCLRVAGIAVAVPVMSATILLVGAVLAHFVLGERVPVRSRGGLGLLAMAVLLLTLESGSAEASVSGTWSWQHVCFGSLAAALAGVSYAVMITSIRGAGSEVDSIGVVFLITATGCVLLGPMGIARTGLTSLLSCRPWDLGLMMLAGALNLMGSLCFVRGLQRTSAVYANTINACQVGLSSFMGIMFLSESLSLAKAFGLGCVCLGMVLVESHNSRTTESSDPKQGERRPGRCERSIASITRGSACLGISTRQELYCRHPFPVPQTLEDRS